MGELRWASRKREVINFNVWRQISDDTDLVKYCWLKPKRIFFVSSSSWLIFSPFISSIFQAISSVKMMVVWFFYGFSIIETIHIYHVKKESSNLFTILDVVWNFVCAFLFVNRIFRCRYIVIVVSPCAHGQ